MAEQKVTNNDSKPTGPTGPGVAPENTSTAADAGIDKSAAGAASTAPVEKKEKKTVAAEEETVQIKRKDFDRLMNQMEKQSKDIELLYKVGDKSRIARELGKEGENLIKQVQVRTWDDTGRIIIGWKLLTNKCEVILGRWVEEQTTTIMFEDGETMTVPLLEFYRKTLKKIEADIVGTTQDIDSQNNKITSFKLQFENGKTLLLNSAFVN